MRRSRVRTLLALALAVLAMPLGACDDNTPTTPSNPQAPVTVTLTFSGSLTPNGALTFPFAVPNGGTVTATLTTVALPADTPIGVSLGNWDGTAGTCQVIVDNSSALEGAGAAGQITAAGNLCVRVYDSRGNVTSPTAFTVTVVHPG
jgi:hypothetical protein